MALGHNIKALRLQKGLSQEELSNLTNNQVSQVAISTLEQRDSTSSKFVTHLANALEVSVEELITGKKSDSVVLTPEEQNWLALLSKLSEEDKRSMFRIGNSLAEPAEEKHNGTK